ncbi:hypothetical protein RRG08_022498 [Elysia crispata]|uniref:Uncharacterized protein n=1 Tax=Elysia crispata TaxID=231223 RepID=A0AAE0Z1H3_9GAST|nr:hypothetical protein RRG08_022498 [Elysia crispata]
MQSELSASTVNIKPWNIHVKGADGPVGGTLTLRLAAILLLQLGFTYTSDGTLRTTWSCHTRRRLASPLSKNLIYQSKKQLCYCVFKEETGLKENRRICSTTNCSSPPKAKPCSLRHVLAQLIERDADTPLHAPHNSPHTAERFTE